MYVVISKLISINEFLFNTQKKQNRCRPSQAYRLQLHHTGTGGRSCENSSVFRENSRLSTPLPVLMCPLCCSCGLYDKHYLDFFPPPIFCISFYVSRGGNTGTYVASFETFIEFLRTLLFYSGAVNILLN